MLKRTYPTPEQARAYLLGLSDDELGALAAETLPAPPARLELVDGPPTQGILDLAVTRSGRCLLCGHAAARPCICASYGHVHRGNLTNSLTYATMRLSIGSSLAQIGE